MNENQQKQNQSFSIKKRTNPNFPIYRKETKRSQAKLDP